MFRPLDGEFRTVNINPSLCTHLIYNLAGMDSETNSVISLDNTADLDHPLSGYKNATNLKITHPHLKVMNKEVISEQGIYSPGTNVLGPKVLQGSF